MQISIIGLDIAKSVFQFEAQGAGVRTERLSRDKLLPAIKKIPATVVAMEACTAAHDWARRIRELGHEVRLLPPAYVKPFVQRNKTDARDAHAIAVAAPTCRRCRSRASNSNARAACTRHATFWWVSARN